MKRLNAHAQAHRPAVATIRFGVGAWLLGIGAYAYAEGYWWGVLFILPAALHFYLGYRAIK